MMNDEQRAGDVLAGAGNSGSVSRADSSGLAAPETSAQAAEPDAEDVEEQEDADEADEPRSRWSFLTEMVVLFAVALTIALLIKTFVVQPFYIPSGSMENTLLIGDKVLVNKIVYRIRPISRGDVVVFNGAGSWLAPTNSPPPGHNPLARLYGATLGPLLTSVKGLFGTAPGQTDYIKRVIGIPGDHVVCCNAQGQITVNGVALHERSYLIPGAKPSEGSFNIVVPPGRLWVMGDNRPESADSRLHDCAYTYTPAKCVPYDKGGTIPEDKVIGRAFMIVWPPSRFRVMPIPPTFDQPGLSHSAALPSVRARSAQTRPALATGFPVRPSAPYLPLAGGLAAAVPLTALERRLRVSRQRRAARALGAGHGPRRG
ncbi:MAG TPA: signal peptidase I [Streptosporangiaceae bacterium]|nr:signal peptidase I [Streptosporangiaceae bacterium]